MEQVMVQYRLPLQEAPSRTVPQLMGVLGQ